MEESGYDPAFAGAVVAASGTIGLIISPQFTIVFFFNIAANHRLTVKATLYDKGKTNGTEQT